MTRDHEKIYQAGKEAFTMGLSLGYNPHVDGSQENVLWANGWRKQQLDDYDDTNVVYEALDE